jgi:hypothetical protein
LFSSGDEDDTTMRLISPEFLHIFDQIMSLLPFATRTDMYSALSSIDARVSAVDSFLSTLRLEHSQPNIRNQLKELWTQHAKEMYPVETESDSGGRAEVGKSDAAVPTPPGSPKGDGGNGS